MMTKLTLSDFLDSQDFYELMQAYRHTPPRYVGYSKKGMCRVYQDYVGLDAEYPLWVSMTVKYYATAREAIDAAIVASKPAQPESKA